MAFSSRIAQKYNVVLDVVPVCLVQSKKDFGAENSSEVSPEEEYLDESEERLHVTPGMPKSSEVNPENNPPESFNI